MISVTTHKMYQPNYSDTMTKEQFEDYLLDGPRDKDFDKYSVRKFRIVNRKDK